MSAETGAPVFSERALSFFWWCSWSQMVVRFIRGSVYLQPYVVNGTWGPIGLAGVQLGSKTRRLIGFFQRSGGVKATESAFVMERAMGIEPTRPKLGKLVDEQKRTNWGYFVVFRISQMDSNWSSERMMGEGGKPDRQRCRC